MLAVRQYTIVNECPTSIPLYVNGASQGTIGSGGNITRTYPNSWDGVMYTSANGGNQNAIFGTSRAGFYGPVSSKSWHGTSLEIKDKGRTVTTTLSSILATSTRGLVSLQSAHLWVFSLPLCFMATTVICSSAVTSVLQLLAILSLVLEHTATCPPHFHLLVEVLRKFHCIRAPCPTSVIQ